MSSFKESFNNYYNYFLSSHIDDLQMSCSVADMLLLNKELVNEAWGVRSDSDLKMNNAVKKTAKQIVDSFYSFISNDDSSFEGYYNCVVDGISLQPKPMKEFVCRINNDWINDFNVYIGIGPNESGNDAVTMRDTALFKYYIQMNNSSNKKPAYVFNKRLNRIDVASCAIISVEWTYGMGSSTEQNKRVFNEERKDLTDDILSTIFHELKHIFDMFKLKVSYEEYNSELMFIQQNYSDFLNMCSYDLRLNLERNILFNALVQNNDIKRMSYKLLKYVILLDLFYLGTYSEAGAHLENFKSELTDERVLKIFDRIYSNVRDKRIVAEDFISVYCPIYRNFLVCVKTIRKIKDYVREELKQLFSDEFYNSFRLIYKKGLKNVLKDDFFDWLFDMFEKNILYFLRNADARVIDRISEIATDEQKQRIEKMLKEIILNNEKENK